MKDGRRPLATTVVNDQDFVLLDDVAAMFQLSVREDAGAITATYKGRTIVLTPDQPLASVSGRLIPLPAAPRRTSTRRWLVPVEFMRALSLIYDAKIDLRKTSRLIVVGDLRVPRVQVHYDFSAAAGHLIIDATPRVASTITKDGDRLNVKFDADAIELATPPVQLPAPSLIQSIHAGEAATLTADLSPRFGLYKATNTSTETSARVAIDVTAQSPETSPPAPSAAPSAQGQPPTPPLPDISQLPLPGGTPNTTSIRTIAIDPGHGGADEGAKSAAGVKEKDLTLTVARKLKATIESRMGVRVLLTREDDRAVSIDDRTAVANNSKADLFISLHANASLRPALSGASITAAFFDDETRASIKPLPPARISASAGGSREIEFVPWAVAQIPHLQESHDLASILQQQFRGHIPLSPRPVESAPLRVLEAANMPAVLIEMGYLTNTDQAKLLASVEFQNTVVQAIFDAVVRFRDALDDSQRDGAVKGGR